MERKGLDLYGRDLTDKGGSMGAMVWHVERAPLQLAVCKRYIAAERDEYGLKDQAHRQAEVSLGDVIHALNDRVRLLERVLLERYQRDGEPAEAAELRRRITEAIRTEWPLRKAQKEAHEMNAGTFGRFEAEALAANAALAAAEAITHALKRELSDRFALRD